MANGFWLYPLPMRILQVYKDYWPVVGGMENHIRLICRGLLARHPDIEPTVLVTNTGRQTIEERIDGVRVIKAGRLATVSSAPISLELFAWMRRLEADVIHLHFPYPIGELAYLFAGRGRPMVMTYHSDIVRQRVLGALYRPFLWQVLRQARLIAVSNPVYIQDSPFLRRYADKCRVIHFGLNLDRFAATPEVEAEAAAWRARYGFRPLLLFVGRLRHYKGVNVLIEAMAQLPEATALIVGVGPMAEEWQQQAAAAGLNDRVHFLGEQPDSAVLALYHAADIFVLPSTNRAETFGIVQLEAMACGRPVICTELGTGTSYVNQNNVTGLVVPANDAPALAAAARQLLADPAERARMGAAGRQRAQTEFSIDAMLDRTLGFYHEALA